MPDFEYNRFRAGLNSNVDGHLERFGARLQSFISSPLQSQGLRIIAEIRRVCQKWLSDNGCLELWLVPVDNLINEYSSNNFIAYNSYFKQHYALIQSPQSQKEAAAIAVGDNFRIADCFRAERTDSLHCSIFQQMDVELVNRNEEETRFFAESMVKKCLEIIHSRPFVCLGSFRQCDLLNWYGTDEPNLSSGCYISDGHTIILPSLPASVYGRIESFAKENFGVTGIEDGRIRLGQNADGKMLYEIWKTISSLIPVNDRTVYAYWIVNLPLARIDGEGCLRPVHHIMSKPVWTPGLDSAALFQLSDEQICGLYSKSYDLMLCSPERVVEIIGGDVRISSFAEQLDVIKRFGQDPKEYAILLEALHVNDMNRQISLSGFAMGIDRLAQFVIGKYDMDNVQLFPTNLPDGKMMHALSIEDAGKDRQISFTH